MKFVKKIKKRIFPFFKKMTRKGSNAANGIKILIIVLLIVGIFSKTYSWLYEEYIGNGVSINFGKISHIVTHYDSAGNLVQDGEQTMTLLYETNMSNVTKGTKYIKIENDGTLDLEYTLSLSYEGTVSNAGILYYRLYEITEEVNKAGDLETYASNNPVPSNLETDSTNPVKNMTLINGEVYQGEILLDPNGRSAVYYRLDYGMYQTVNTSLYSNESMSLHFDVYSTQIGATDESSASGQIWQVSSEEQLREILISASNGDTIQLLESFEVAGTVNIGKRINLDTNDHTLTITGDLVYDFANMGELLIDVTGNGVIIVENDLYINTPKAEVDILGGNKAYDIVVNGNVTVDGLQDGEKDGIYLESLNIVNSTSTMVPSDLTVLGNTRLTVSSNVNLGTVSAAAGSTNIEVINNGNIVQLNFSEMDLLKTFTKAQIYVYNLGNIYGIVGSTSIVLPKNSTPYLGPNNGNTWIVKGITSNDITISGADNFGNGDIEDNMDDVYVVPIDGEDNSYIVYIKDSVSAVEGLLVDYFKQEGYDKPYEQIYEIRKLVIYTLNAQYFENEDFEFLKSDKVPYLKHLDLSHSRIIDDETPNRVMNEALKDKTSLLVLKLPSTLTEIGNYAFSGISLGIVPNSIDEEFEIMTIPSSVTDIGEYAFDSSEFVYFESNIPPIFSTNTFDADLTKFFVNVGVYDKYLELDTISEAKIYQKGQLSDDRKYFVFEYNEGLGISYVINNVVSTSTLGIPTNITYGGSNKKVLVIGMNAYRHMDIYNDDGVSVSLPSSVVRIDYSAFRDLNIISIGLGSVVEVMDYSFNNTKLDSLLSDSIQVIGKHAFEDTLIQELSLASIDTIEDYAFNNVDTMYSAYLYNVSYIGKYAFNNCKYLNKVYFSNKETVLVNNGEEIDITVLENGTFSNWGFYTDGRLRVYVPDGSTESGNTYLSLYQKKFEGNENYIFVTGHEIGSYKHYAVPYDINVYTVREVELHGINGWEIISYQGADLNGDYVIPETLTYNGTTKNVISIGDYAYRNVLFEEDETISIENNSLVKLGKYALSNMDIVSIKATGLIEVGEYALYDTILQTAEFDKLQTLGAYSLADLLTLNMVNLGTVTNIGYGALYNAANLEQVFINNSNYDVVVSQNAFYNVGLNASDRFRMYVPSGETSLNYYKTLFVDYGDYVFETGLIVGSYINSPIMYDIGEYSVKEVTLEDRDGNQVTGYELIEYHGADLSNLFDLPDKVSTDKSEISVTTELVTSWPSNGYEYQYNIIVTNNSEETLTDWKVKFDTTDITISNIWNYTYESFDNYAIISSGNNQIAANSSVKILIQVNSSSASYSLKANYYDDATEGLPLISIGDRAFVHTKSNSGINITLDNQYLINIGNYAFDSVKGIKTLDLPMLTTLGDYAFSNNDLNRVETPNLESIGSYALSNMASLYYIDLGKVINMEENSLYNLNNLLQVYFMPTDDTIVFDSDAINNVGSLTEDRIRFYVNKKSTTVEKEKTETVELDVSYTSTYSRRRHTVTATVSNPTTYDISNWSVDIDLGSGTYYSSSTSNTGASFTSSGNTLTAVGDGNTATIGAMASVQFVFVVSINDRNWTPSFGTVTGTRLYIDKFEENIEYVNLYKNSFNEKYKNYFYTKGEIIGTFTPANIPFEIGEYSVDYVLYKDTVGGEHYGLEIIEWHGDDVTGDFVIPNTLTINGENLPVISIGEYAFRWTQMADGEVINIDSNGLLRIDEYAFYNIDVYSLNARNVDYVGQYAFYDNLLSTVSLPNLHTLGDYALANNVALNYIHLGTVSNIGVSALEGCTALEQIFFTNKNADTSTVSMKITVGENAFSNIATIIGKRFRIYVPAGNINTTSTYVDGYKNTLPGDLSNYIYETGILVNDYTYSVLPYNIHEFSVKQVTINNITGYEIIEYHGPDITSSFELPNSIEIDGESLPVISIGTEAYMGVEVATNEVWDLVIPSNMLVIGEKAFYQTGITSIYSEANLESIGVEAFAEMPNLTNANLGEVKYIYDKAFNLNNALTTVRIGTSILSIGSQAFYNTYNNSSLTRVYIDAADPPVIQTDTWPDGTRFIFWTTYKFYFYVPRQSETDYEEATNWSTYSGNINPSSELYDNTYYYSLDEDSGEITIVEYIGNANNTLTIPDTFTIDSVTYNVTSIESGAFDASNFRTLVLPRYLSYVEEGFLSGNTSITNINVNANNTLFSSVDGVLYDYSGETLIRYPRARTDSEYTLDSNTKVLANTSFMNSLSLTTINFNSNLLAIGTNVFAGATSLNTMNFTSVTPPYLMGFNSFPTNYNLTINYPSASGDAYTNNLFYNSYRDYLMAN